MRVTPVSAAPSAAAPSAAESVAVGKAAREFEALLLQRMLAAARPAESGPAADWRAMADERLAADLAAASPLGIAALLAGAKGATR